MFYGKCCRENHRHGWCRGDNGESLFVVAGVGVLVALCRVEEISPEESVSAYGLNVDTDQMYRGMVNRI